MLGYSSEDLVGGLASREIHPDDIPSYSAPGPGETTSHVARVKHRDGSWRWIESLTTNLTHEPAVRAYVTNFRDITERKITEQALVESQRRLEFLLSATSAVTYITRASGDFGTTFMSSNVQQVLGHEASTFYVDPGFWRRNVHPEDVERAAPRCDALGASDSFTREYRFRHDNGSYRWMRDVARVIRGTAGEPIEIVGYWIDVTEQVNAVAERHEMFARMALADRMLSVGTLAAGVAHEINNPLAFIGNNLELLSAELPGILAGGRSRLSTAELQGLVADSREGVARVSAIVRDLRLLSRHDDEKRGPVDVADVLATSIKMAHNEIRHRARVVQSYQGELPPVMADASKLGQVFLNLLLNAAQAIAEGHAEQNEIRVRARRTADERSVCVEIEDTGAGIAANIMHRIFDPFFTTKVPGAGTGLGLSISHQIVQSMNGQIAVDSTPGHGSTFSVTLPVAPSQRARDSVEGPKVSATTARILLIDDEPAVGRSLRLLLAPEMDVLPVTRAREAINLLTQGERFDAILCDLMMPDVSGIELYDRLVDVAPAYQKRIIFMTGGAFTPQGRDFLAKLDRPYLEKPFTEAQLRQAIESVAG
jgi:signal transduction histidine kinase/CheY-like chemotaxis protein